MASTPETGGEKTGKKKVIKKKIIKKIVRKKKVAAAAPPPEPVEEPEDALEPVVMDEAPEPVVEDEPVAEVDEVEAAGEVESVEESEEDDIEEIDDETEDGELEQLADDGEEEAGEVADEEPEEEDPNATVPVMAPAKKASSSRRRFGSRADKDEDAGASGSRREAGAAGARSTSRGRAGGTMRTRGERPAKKDNLKLVVVAVCVLMFFACVGLGVYIVFLKKPPETKQTNIERNPGQEIKDALPLAKTKFQAGIQAYDAENWQEAIDLLKNAEGIAANAVAMIEDLRSKPEFSGEDFAGWETIALQFNQIIKETRDKIFTAENRQRNAHRKSEPANNNTPAPSPEPDRELTPEEEALEERGPQDE